MKKYSKLISPEIFPPLSLMHGARNYEEKDKILKGSGSLYGRIIYSWIELFTLGIGSKNASEFCTVDKF